MADVESKHHPLDRQVGVLTMRSQLPTNWYCIQNYLRREGGAGEGGENYDAGGEKR